MKVLFQLERETKGAVRYMEVDASGNTKAIGEGAVIGTLYIRKTSLEGQVPTSLSIEVSF